MPLEIRHNKAENTHENVQFRRIGGLMLSLFEQQKWDGIFIGNPFNESYLKFRADAILLYNHGVVIFDFKDYSGNLIIPENEDEFFSKPWYCENAQDKTRIEIGAGAKFINPFRQLKYYREGLYDIIKDNNFMSANIDPSRVAAINVFSGPVLLSSKLPGKYPYYKIVDEINLGNFLFDFSSRNTYNLDSANALKKVFKSEDWKESIPFQAANNSESNQIQISRDSRAAISSFLDNPESGILVLKSSNYIERDEWMQSTLAGAKSHDVTQIEIWAHSGRIAKRISKRTGVEIQSLYSAIYAGNIELENGDSADENLEEDDETDEIQKEIVGIRSDENMDAKALIIIHEAHLITSSLHQSDLLKFGSGKLLDDLFDFLKLGSSGRKLICIGDPYSLTYGKPEESALDVSHLQELTKVRITQYKSEISLETENSLSLLKDELSIAIENKKYNYLKYRWDKQSMSHEKIGSNVELLKQWFKEPTENEPLNTALFFKLSDARKTNLWIKQNCLGNGTELNQNDLLIVNNNIVIPDETGYGNPTILSNGMYLQVQNVLGEESTIIKVGKAKKPVPLHFINLKVRCISITGKPEANVWILKNAFQEDDEISDLEKIAFRIYVNRIIKSELDKFPFRENQGYKDLVSDVVYSTLSSDEKNAIEILIDNYKRKKEDKAKVSTTGKARTLLSKYRKKAEHSVLNLLKNNNSKVNTVYANYGWALTVHKALGSTFKNVLINAKMAENKGPNDAYFRWLYTAVNVASEKLFVVNPMDLNPLMELSIRPDTEKGSTKISISEYQPSSHYADKLSSVSKPSVVATIDTLAGILEQQGCILEQVKLYTEFLTKVYFSVPSSEKEQLILDIDNKGEKDSYAVGSIRVNKAGGMDLSKLNHTIQETFDRFTGNSIEKKQGDAESNTLLEIIDFRKEVYENWKTSLEISGWKVFYLTSHPYQDVFLAEKKGETIKFKAYYNNDGFFSTVLYAGTDDQDLIEEFKHCLTYGIES